MCDAVIYGGGGLVQISRDGGLHRFWCGDVRVLGYSDVSGAVPADQLRGVGEAAAVMYQKTTGAGEFIRLLRDDADGEFFTGQVGAGQFEGFGGVGVFDVDDGGLGVLPAGGQLFEGRVRLVGFGEIGRASCRERV